MRVCDLIANLSDQDQAAEFEIEFFVPDDQLTGREVKIHVIEVNHRRRTLLLHHD